MSKASLYLPVCLIWVALSLCGCGANSTGSEGVPGQVGLGSINGQTHGGRQPISGAKVYVYAAGTAGYGSASTSLLTATSGGLFPTSKDASGNYYVTTDSNGNFSLSGDYTCVSGTQVYLYGSGGDAGGGSSNANIGLLALLGQCPSTGTLAGLAPTVYVNEVSTVAAAWALAAYTVDATHIGSSNSTLGQQGIANAFMTAQNLYNSQTGGSTLALTTTPAGNGTVPQKEIHAIANSLAACVNSAPPAYSQCGTLFADARIDGTTTGTVPVDTAGAAINMAHYPATNVAAIFGLTAGVGSPFQPTLAKTPNDFSIVLSYSGGGLNEPAGIDIDGFGNVWTVSQGNNTVNEFSPVGAAISPSAGYTGGGISQPGNLVLDASNNLWIVNSAGTLSKFYNSGAPASATAYSLGITNPTWLNIDPYGYLWAPNRSGGVSKFNPVALTYGIFTAPGGAISVADASGNEWIETGQDQLVELRNSGATAAGSPFSVGSSVQGLAADRSGNIWAANGDNGAGASLTKFLTAGDIQAPGSPFTGGGLAGVEGAVVDGAGNVWIGDDGGLSGFSNAGTTLSANGFLSSAVQSVYNLAIDGSGNIWLTNYQQNPNYGSGYNGTTIAEYVGIAKPVITPLASALAANKLGTEP